MANIDIQSQTEKDNGWAYEVKLNHQRRDYNYSVTLSRSDYEKWASGQQSPNEVIQAAFDFLLEREGPGSIMSQFDCSVIRRFFPEVDRELPKKL